MSTILPKGNFAVIQERKLTGTTPVLNIVNNEDGTYTMRVSYSVTFTPDEPGSDTQDIDLANTQGIDYAGFPRAGADVNNDLKAFCSFSNQNNGVILVTQFIKTKGVKVNHG